MRKTKEMFQTFQQAWGKSIQKVISAANEIAAPKIEETLKAASCIIPKTIEKQVCDIQPKPLASQPMTSQPLASPTTIPLPSTLVSPLAPLPELPKLVLSKPIPTLSLPVEKLQPTLEPKFVKMSRVISTQTLGSTQTEQTECKAEKEMISLDYHWNILKLLFIMHVISLVIMAFLAFRK